MITIGLTGSIGMGKSETARMFAKLGVPVLDSDQIVHRLYAKGGRAVKPVSEAFPASLVSGAIDRKILANLVLGNAVALNRLETIVHPLVRETQNRFIDKMRQQGAKFIILEIPLLFETGADKWLDKTIVVSAGADIQRARVLARPQMNLEKFSNILRRQMPDEEKCHRADIVIDTSTGLETTFARVRQIVRGLGGRGGETDHA